MPSNGGIVVAGNSCIDEYRYSKTDDVTWGNKIEAEEKIEGGPFFGGAACNIVASLTAMGCENIIPLTAVGDDAVGRDISSYYKNMPGVCTKHVQEGGVSGNSIVIVHRKTGRRNIVIMGRAPLKRFEHGVMDRYGADWAVLASVGELAQEAFARVADRQHISLLAILGKNEIAKINEDRLTLPPKLRDRPNSILVLNREEFGSLRQKHAMLSMAFQEIVVTDGPNNIMTNCDANEAPVFYSEKDHSYHMGKWLTVPAINAEVVDTSGAGDLFCAGYLHARRLDLGRTDAIKFASIVSAFGISRFGAHNGVREIRKVTTRQEALRFIEDFYRPLGEAS